MDSIRIVYPSSQFKAQKQRRERKIDSIEYGTNKFQFGEEGEKEGKRTSLFLGGSEILPTLEHEISRKKVRSRAKKRLEQRQVRSEFCANSGFFHPIREPHFPP